MKFGNKFRLSRLCVGEFHFNSFFDSILILFYSYLFFVSDVHMLFCERLSTVLKKQ